jgi:GntR family transcriptional regulator/MocR family aminotransferase
MSLSRRLALLAWSQDACAWILEDGCDSEHRFGDRPLDQNGRIRYLGTCSGSN